MRTDHCLEIREASKKGKNGDGGIHIYNLRERLNTQIQVSI